TANDVPAFVLPGTPAASLSANTANIGQTSIYFTSTFKIPANTLTQATSYRLTLFTDDGFTGNDLFAIRMGHNGNTTDAIVWSYSFPGGPIPYVQEFILTVRNPGSTANVVSALTIGNNNNYAAQYATVDTTQDLYLGCTYNIGYPWTGDTVFEIATIE